MSHSAYVDQPRKKTFGKTGASCTFILKELMDSGLKVQERIIVQCMLFSVSIKIHLLQDQKLGMGIEGSAYSDARSQAWNSLKQSKESCNFNIDQKVSRLFLLVDSFGLMQHDKLHVDCGLTRSYY